MPRSIQQLVRNQILFREVNERVLEIVEHTGEPAEFLCECGQEECIETIQLSLDTYERIRSHSNLFLVRPGHETPGVERVVHQGDSYVLVAKTVRVEEVEGSAPRAIGAA